MPHTRTRLLSTLGSELSIALWDWRRDDMKGWLYVAKVLTAAFVALGVSTLLDLPTAKTAMTTVFIVMHPQSGAVLAKSFYRLIGTLIGFLATVTVVGAFPQQPLLFIFALAFWVSLCAAFAKFNRGFRSYGFLISGYTVALAGIPASQHPEATFLIAMTRVTGIAIGVLCATAVSALIFPDRVSSRLSASNKQRYVDFLNFVVQALIGKDGASAASREQLRFFSDAVAFEMNRTLAAFEGAQGRHWSGRLSKINAAFMKASSRLNAFCRMRAYLEASRSDAYRAIGPLLQETAAWMTRAESLRDASPNTAKRIADDLHRYADALPGMIEATRRGSDKLADFSAPEFEATARALQYLVADLAAYFSEYARLDDRKDVHDRQADRVARFPHHNSYTDALIASARVFITIFACGFFWVASAWPSGVDFLLNAAVTSALISGLPHPVKASINLGISTVFSAIFGFVFIAYVEPRVDGILILWISLAPFLAIGAWFATKPKYFRQACDYLIFFSLLVNIDTLGTYEQTTFLNEGIAFVFSNFVPALFFALIMPPASRWLKNRHLVRMRELILHVASRPTAGPRTTLEGQARDLTFQIQQLFADSPVERQEAIRWAYAILQIGNTLIDLQNALALVPSTSVASPAPTWRLAILRARSSIAALTEKPTASRLEVARDLTRQAITGIEAAVDACPPSKERRQSLLHVLSLLNIVDITLLDAELPFADADVDATPLDKIT
ncbi:fusaric acid resistance family protein [Burkholderia cenocepacia]|uniref:FUSC family protein n=1 Tax=Burkholderia cenocepacia TaxID=95486 RepID=UPI00098119BD|nr:FUSC family protein [Burkholderia cenocepacia]ONR83387.1 fusaric acid resistance family protein [Burkholderia cenocepacia]